MKTIRWMAGGTLALGVALACGGVAEISDDGGEEAAGLPEVTLSEEDVAKAKELVDTHKNGFDFKAKKEVNAHIWNYIAATAEDDAIQRSALLEMKNTFVTEERWVDKGKQLVNDDYEAIVLHYLNEDDVKLQAAAIEAARNVVRMKGKKDSPVREWIVAAVEKSGDEARQVHALETLQTEPDALKDERVFKAFMGMLDSSEPWAVSATLFRTNTNVYSLQDKPAFRAKVVELLKAKDPGVRGRAAEGLGAVSSSMGGSAEKSEAVDLLTPMLTDENAYTRAAAIKGLVSLRNAKSIHDFMKMLADKTECRWDISYTDLAGSSQRIHHDGSAWSRIDDAALSGIESLAFGLRNAKFERPKVDYKAVDKGMADGVKAAKAWYSKNKSKIQ